MTRKIFAGILIGLSALFFLSSLVATGAVWYYNEPLTQEVLSRLQMVDSELGLAQSALQDARLEIERTLRIVESAEVTLSELKEELTQARALFGEVDGTLENQLVPGLQGTREQINNAIAAVEEIRAFLKQINDIPLVDLNLPGDELLLEIIAVGVSLDDQIADVQALAEKATVFLDDASYLMGGDLGETKQNLNNFLLVINDYDQKLTGWRAQVADVTQSLPGWVDTASASLTIFLLWFAFSQFGVFLHGLSVWRGGDPLAVLRRS
ncbi:MAG: hypothetical protein CVU44_00380 [Chloroflexi bacterium HGW-Chloroflexi-6]|nr:MAG: hypothetical protein CVU44_00380 [Chloroflexi bacterium HGW-Chloroflexi-6]